MHGYKLDPAQWFLESFRWTKHLMILDINQLPWSPSSHHSWHVSTLMIQEIWVHWKFWKHNFCFRGYGESDSPKGREHYKTSLLVNDIKEIVSALTCITETADWMKNLNTKLLRLYISSMRSSVSSPQETLTRELKIQCAAEYFWRTLRCFIWWWNTVECLIYYLLLKQNDFRRSSFLSDFQTSIKL